MTNKKTVLAIITLIILSFNINFVNAQLETKYPNYKELEYKGLNYGFYKPLDYDTNKSYPLVMVLNGFNDTITHDLVYYKETFQKNNPCFVLTPICHGNPFEGGGWYDPFNDTLLRDGKLAVEIIEKTVHNYNIDTNRLYIHGGSMGGHGTFGILSKFPETFAAAYIICGAAKVEIAKRLINIPLWIFHGELDDAVPIHLSRNIYNEIIKQGGNKVRYTVYQGVKHNSWENASEEKTLETWLFKQEKGKIDGIPDTPEGFTVEKHPSDYIGNDNILKWDLPLKQPHRDIDIWYYIILKNNEVLVEVDGNINHYIDHVILDNEYYSYKLIAVNYYFKKSKPTKSVGIKK